MKYLCTTTVNGYRKGEVYDVDKGKIRTLVQLGYLDPVTENIKIQTGGKKK